MHCIRVVIADRHPIVRQGLANVLGTERDFRLVACCGDGPSCIEAIRLFAPEIALVDPTLPNIGGRKILAVIRAETLRTRVVLFTGDIYESDIAILASGGAHSVISKDTEPNLLLQILRQVANHHISSPPTSYELESAQETPNKAKATHALTDRERQIMRLVSEGLSNKEIARRLNLTDGTIKVHLHRIFQKLDVSNRTVLATLAISQVHKLDASQEDGEGSFEASPGTHSTIADEIKSARD
ncbi:response regulator transcription factor [Bradyrhizobium sp. CB3481]|uniref:LuxR C-terminal-related transcriptional regulator n=1 Tax=Bradyrhizobium sp. CB3481 TaxID=3039158 RepID=UPI0024B0D1B8|nr:response regulator transcription factor [Bradyrhizobium sp. CB3481]WFU18455.1 response regulator transcription factor [Bradyrhizobium sp. CB3481]